MLVTDRADKREIAVLTSANTTCRPEAQHEVLLGSEANGLRESRCNISCGSPSDRLLHSAGRFRGRRHRATINWISKTVI